MAQASLGRRFLTALRGSLRSFVTVHPWYKLFSFLLALGMWLWVQGEQVIDRLIEVDVTYRWPAHLVLTSDPPDTIEAIISGTRSEVQRARHAAVAMYIDMREANPGVQTLAFVDQDIQGLSDDVKVVNLRQRDFEVVLEPRRDKRVRVQVDTIGEPMRDYQVGAISLEPEFIWIEGPASVVSGLESVRTVGVPLSSQQESFTVEVDVALPDDNLRRREDALIKVIVEVVESLGTVRFEDVSLRPPSGWRAEPSVLDVLVTGPSSVVQEMKASDLLVTGSVPSDGARVPRKVRSDTFEVVHGGPASLQIRELFPETVALIPVDDVAAEVPIEPEGAEPAPPPETP